MPYTPNVTCQDYRGERRLLALKQQLSQADLPREERERLEAEVADLEKELGMD